MTDWKKEKTGSERKSELSKRRKKKKYIFINDKKSEYNIVKRIK